MYQTSLDWLLEELATNPERPVESVIEEARELHREEVMSAIEFYTGDKNEAAQYYYDNYGE